MYQPPLLARPNEVIIHAWSYQSLGMPLTHIGSGPATGVWPAIGLVIFVPFTLSEPLTVTKLWWDVAAQSGNADAGIYDASQNLLLSAGTTVIGAATNIQSVDVTDTLIARGQYYLALVADNTTFSSRRSAPAAGICQALGLLEQTSVTLPLSTGASPATFAKYTRAYIPFFGLMGYRGIGP